MAKTGFFSFNGGIGVGGATKAELLNAFGTTSTASDSVRLLIADNDSNPMLGVTNDHMVSIDANTVWFANDDASILELSGDSRGHGGLVQFAINGEVIVKNGFLALAGNQAGGNMLKIRPAVDTADYEITFPNAQPAQNNQVMIFQTDGTASFSDLSGGTTLQNAYDNGPSGTIDMDDDVPMFFEGSAMTADKNLLIVSKETTVSAANTGRHFAVKTDAVDASLLTLHFNGEDINLFAASTVDMNAATLDVDTTGAISLDSSAGAVNLTSAGSTATVSSSGLATLTSTGDAVAIDGSGAVDINSSAGAINVGNDADTGAINVGTGAAARTISIGNATGATVVNLDSGTGGVSINAQDTGAINIGTETDTGNISVGTGASARTIAIGNESSTTSVDIDAGTNGVTIDAQGVGAISIGAQADTGAINVGTGEAARLIKIGNETGATALDLDAGTGGVSVDAQGAGAISIGAQADTGAINVGTGAAARTITIGNATGITALDFDAGTGGITMDAEDAIGIATSDASNADIGIVAGGTGNVNITGDRITLTGNVVITDNLYINGNVTSVNTEALNVTDPLILLGNGNPADAKDLGLVLEYYSSSLESKQHAAFFRDATAANNNRFVLADRCTYSEANNVVTVTEYAGLELANLRFTHNSGSSSDIVIPNGEANALDIKDTSGNTLVTYNTASGNDDVAITINGNLIVAATGGDQNGVVSAVQFLTTSDATLKTNIKVIDNAVNMVNEFSGVSYTWKNQENMVEPIYGVLAQEVEKVMPGAVNTDAYGKKTVAYNQLVGVLVEAVKSLGTELNALKAHFSE